MLLQIHVLLTCLFSYSKFQLRQTVLRVWDCLFFDGSIVLLLVGLNIILQHSDAVLCCRSTADILDVFRDVPNSPHVTRCHEFIQVVSPLSRLVVIHCHCHHCSAFVVHLWSIDVKIRFLFLPTFNFVLYFNIFCYKKSISKKFSLKPLWLTACIIWQFVRVKNNEGSF